MTGATFDGGHPHPEGKSNAWILQARDHCTKPARTARVNLGKYLKQAVPQFRRESNSGIYDREAQQIFI